MKNLTQNELISDYSNARDTYNKYDGDSKSYWKGVMNTYKVILDRLYPKWTTTEIGREVFMEDKSFSLAK